MSFAGEVKAQLCRCEVRTAELAAYELWGLSMGRKDYKERRLFLERKAGEYQIFALQLEAGQARAFLRGCFISCGSVNAPDKEPHMELRFHNGEDMELCRETMIMSGFPPHASVRRDYLVLYIKKAERIVEFLTYLGAYKAVLDFENAQVNKEVNRSVNRTVNCDMANIERTRAAGQEQIDQIRDLMASGKFQGLPETVKELAELRLKNPDATLEELGRMLTPSLSKSGVAHRMRQLKG